MAKFKMRVLSNPIEGRDQEFNEWYDNVHWPDVLDVKGVAGAERYRRHSSGKWRYLALYELDCDDPTGVERELRTCAGTDVMPISDAFDPDDFLMGTAEAIVPYRSA
jgi:hypothetical protein